MQKQINQLINLLKHKGISFDEGLSDNETIAIQNTFGIEFPPDLKLFLKTGLPISESFVHWRYGLNSSKGFEDIKERLKWPIEGFIGSLKSSNGWVDSWKNKPVTQEDWIVLAKKNLESYPKLIPIYSHRYIPSTPNEIGNPVFSVMGRDIIYYGNDLASYFSNEFYFKLSNSFGETLSPKHIKFWSDVVF